MTAHAGGVPYDDVLRTIGKPFGIEPLDRVATESAVLTDRERGEARGVKGSPQFFRR